MVNNNPQGNDHLQSLSMTDSVISVKQVTKNFGDEIAIREVTFDARGTSIFGFIGPSGSGKTTTIRLLTGIYIPNQGNVSVFNFDPSKFCQDQHARLGYMPQLLVLYPNLTVWENINFAASLYGMNLVRGKRLKQIMNFVELYEHRRKR